MIKHILLLAIIISVFTVQTINSLAAGIPNEYKALTTTLVDTVIKIDRNPGLGFNFPYYIRIPKGLNQNDVQYLLVETNNSGVNDSLSHHEKETYLETIRNSLGSSLCSGLKVPFLMPVFPRPAKEGDIYTHAFDRDAAMIKEGEMKRLDLQLIAMVENAKTVLKQYGITIKEKFLMNGFSASGTFANRFTLIHPTLVAAIACGGINAMPILCISNLGKTKLEYPIGISDFKLLFGTTVDLEEYKKVPQYIYMGKNDKNDAVLFDDAYSKEERKIILTLLGKELVPERFSKCESIYVENKVNSTFRVYPAIGHETDRQVFNDVIAFLNKIRDQK